MTSSSNSDAGFCWSFVIGEGAHARTPRASSAPPQVISGLRRCPILEMSTLEGGSASKAHWSCVIGQRSFGHLSSNDVCEPRRCVYTREQPVWRVLLLDDERKRRTEMFQKSIALAFALLVSVACSDDAAPSDPTGAVTTSPSTTGTPAATTTGGATLTSGTNAGPTSGTTSPSTTTGASSATGAGGATTGTVTFGDTGTTTGVGGGVGGGTTSGDTSGTTTGGTTEMAWLPSWATTIQRTETSNLPPSL